MKKIVFSVVFLFSIFYSSAQTPTFQWAKQMGGTFYDDIGKSIATDGLGNVYTAGYFKGTGDFDPGSGTFNLVAYSGYSDIFISKLDASGNFIWAKSMGGTLDDACLSISIDVSGNIYATGYFQGTADFNPGSGTYNLTSLGVTDIFISKLDASGNFIWAKNMGGTADISGNSIAVDSAGNVYTTGNFQGSVDFNPSSGTFNLTSAGMQDIFMSKLDASGNFVWAKQIGGAVNDRGNSIKVNTSGEIYTTGYFTNTVDFDPGLGTSDLISPAGNTDIFILKLDASGNFAWAKNIGEALDDEGRSIALDASGNVFTTGCFYGTVDFDPSIGIVNLTSGGYRDIFISKLDGLGNFVWAKNMEGNVNDFGNAIDVDALGNVYTTGNFSDTVDFDPGLGIYDLISSGGDVFISKLDASGNFQWAKNMGFVALGQSIALDGSNNIFTTGWFGGTIDFDPDAGITNLSSPSSMEVFVHKMSQTPISINEIQIENNIFVFPNPSNNFIDIETTLTDYSLSVFDIMGKLIFTENSSQNKTRINISNFSNGIYFLQLSSGDKIISKKFIKE